MQTDPFALIRKRDKGVSTSFSRALEHPEHPETAGVFLENPQKSAVAHQEHEEHRKNGEAAESGTVPTIRERDYRDVPPAWRDGLGWLNAMPMPRAAEAARWAQIVLDAHKFAWLHFDDPQLDRWSLESLFGFDPKQPDQHSLILDIRGGWVVSLGQDERGRDVAMIANGGRTRWHLRRTINAPLLWAPLPIGRQNEE